MVEASVGVESLDFLCLRRVCRGDGADAPAEAIAVGALPLPPPLPPPVAIPTAVCKVVEAELAVPVASTVNVGTATVAIGAFNDCGVDVGCCGSGGLTVAGCDLIVAGGSAAGSLSSLATTNCESSSAPPPLTPPDTISSSTTAAELPVASVGDNSVRVSAAAAVSFVAADVIAVEVSTVATADESVVVVVGAGVFCSSFAAAGPGGVGLGLVDLDADEGFIPGGAPVGPGVDFKYLRFGVISLLLVPAFDDVGGFGAGNAVAGICARGGDFDLERVVPDPPPAADVSD